MITLTPEQRAELAKDQRRRRDAKAEAELARLRDISEHSDKYGICAVLDALDRYSRGRPLPDWLLMAVRNHLRKTINKTALHDYDRWQRVRKYRDGRYREFVNRKDIEINATTVGDLAKLEQISSEIEFDPTFELVATQLKNAPSAGKASTIKKGYLRVEHSLPARLRYRKTYRKRR
jgi:hypothetical protein